MEKKDHFTRRAFIQGTIVTGLGLTLNLGSCKKPSLPEEPTEPTKPDETPEPDDNEDTFKVTDVSFPFQTDVSKGMALTIAGVGFATGDGIVFQPVAGTNHEKVTVETTSVTDLAAVVVLPDTLHSIRYEIYVTRGTESLYLGATNLNVVFNATIPDQPGMTVKGTVYAAGAGLAGVVVSDGHVVSKTDAEGIYYLPSAKKNGYVFVSIPANYEVATDERLPLFFNRLARAEHIVEIMDFELTAVDNNNHVVMVLGDMHLANRNQDVSQFQSGFLADVNQSISRYQQAGKKVYALTLGDMTWETYWQSNNYSLPDYLQEMNKINAPVFNTIGNHDNNPAKTGDWETADRFRTILGPTYYSFNIGKVHYVVLDNIEYLNTNNRNYNGTIVADQMAWLIKDLDIITDKSTPIFVAMHIQLASNPNIENGGSANPRIRLTNGQELIDVLSAFDTVHVFTGHTHMNYNIRYSPSLMEHNIGVVCATWWWTGRLANNHICKDGTPGGYEIWEADNRDLKWTYKSIGYDEDYQFRAYDLNKVHITKDAYAPDYTGTSWNTYAVEYADQNQRNEVLINVWNYDTDWTVTVTESGSQLPVTRVHVRDPLHIISYAAKRLDTNAVPTADFVTAKSSHLFKVQASSPTSTLEITVTDGFGRVYTEQMVRPKELEYLMR
ncbi:calcineurin-like phosphoesterase family protein [Parapedobacter sp. 10938]|uniref:calcineurin-like phosphoesterase family protein n=1 Tax=Parapedobacter flavus TaxID=3110225 RepID=UPI002DB876CF|nr:calcineurin-like phosphoesterase family protein [Parapedobacter sp. 10938]MEC3879719.1 calcineurin-like phosphoesterase family protein [Parapedobacter sp. 10938]